MEHTKKAIMSQKYREFNRSFAFELGHVYGRYSEAKARAWDYCLSLADKYNGGALRILSANTMIFTVGFVGEINNRKAFFYITPSYDRYIYLDEIAEYHKG